MILSVTMAHGTGGNVYRTLRDGAIQVDVFTLDMPFVGDGVRGTTIREAGEHVYIERYLGMTRAFESTNDTGNVMPVFYYEGWRITIEDETSTPCIDDERLYRQVYLVARRANSPSSDSLKRTVVLMVEGRYRDNGRQPALRQELFMYLSEHLVNPKPYHERR
jgi:hypothetical protein